MTRVLWCDLAGRTGYCHDSEDPRKPAYGLIVLPKTKGDDFGPVYSHLRRELIERIRIGRPDAIGFEAAIQAMAQMRRTNDRGEEKLATNTRTMRLLNGYVSTVECLAADFSIRCFEKGATTIKKHFTSDGHADKPAMIKMCHMRGFRDVDDDNVADAIAGWDFLKCLLDSRFAVASTPIFRR